jgi:uncharacterized protein with PIN domain
MVIDRSALIERLKLDGVPSLLFKGDDVSRTDIKRAV